MQHERITMWMLVKCEHEEGAKSSVMGDARRQSTVAKRDVEGMAVGVGFEPTDPCGSPVFKTGSLNRSDTPPRGGGVFLQTFPAEGKGENA
ncbi:MAG: hypothetical protein PWP23_1527 [Candidatus Sumerlaeota bacterium]|nr:hypothetical protein [Candidatus Sumerlaeota bacterium]